MQTEGEELGRGLWLVTYSFLRHTLGKHEVGDGGEGNVGRRLDCSFSQLRIKSHFSELGVPLLSRYLPWGDCKAQ